LADVNGSRSLVAVRSALIFTAASQGISSDRAHGNASICEDRPGDGFAAATAL